MKKRLLAAMVLGALVTSCVLSSGCSPQKNQSASPNNSTVHSSAASENSKEEAVSAISADESSRDVTESSDISEAESSTPEESSRDEQPSAESSAENSEENSSEESSLPEMYDGYYFDDEQIVEDYHTAHDFTDNEAFNKMFADNPLNQQFEADSREVENESDMRALTIRYGELWKQEAQDAYEKLSALLKEVPAQKEKLIESQEKWEASLGEIEQGFIQEASEQGVRGTQAMLAADSAMMNYYKGRAAVLYEQIYQLTQTFSLD